MREHSISIDGLPEDLLLLHEAIEAVDEGTEAIAEEAYPDTSSPPSSEQIAVLLEAAKENEVEAVRTCLTSTPVDACHEQFKRTALHWAAENGSMRLCELLLQHKADPNFLDRTSASPLHKAAWNGHGTACKLLLAHGSNPTLRDEDGDTPSDGASSTEVQNIIREVEHGMAQALEKAPTQALTAILAFI